jgi:hypothetical protein
LYRKDYVFLIRGLDFWPVLTKAPFSVSFRLISEKRRQQPFGPLAEQNYLTAASANACGGMAA